MNRTLAWALFIIGVAATLGLAWATVQMMLHSTPGTSMVGLLLTALAGMVSWGILRDYIRGGKAPGKDEPAGEADGGEPEPEGPAGE